MLKRFEDWVYAPVAALVLCAVTLVVCVVVIVGPTLAIRRELGRLGVRIMLLSIGIPIRVTGRQYLPAAGTAAIVVSNHASYIDGLVLTAALPRHYSFVVQDGAASWPLVGLTLRRMGVLFVNRASARESARLTRQMMRRLHHGEPLAIFPEGTFAHEPGLLPFKSGAFLMAARERTPVIPAGIRGTRRVYGGGRRLPRWAPISIRFEAPIHPQGNGRDTALDLRERARARVLALSGEPDPQATAAPAEASAA